MQELLGAEWFRKAIAPVTPTDFVAAVASGAAEIFNADNRGLIVVQDRGDGVAEWHWLLGPGMPVQEKLAFARKVIRALQHRGFRSIVGVTPYDNMPARVMNRNLGGQPVERRPEGIVYVLDI